MPDNINPNNEPNSIVFIDSTVPDYQSLAAAVAPGTDVIIIYPTGDEINQITDVLAARHNINAVHIVSHGSPGSLQLGNSQLNEQNLHVYANQLQQWRNSLTSNADILLYGCNVGADLSPPSPLLPSQGANPTPPSPLLPSQGANTTPPSPLLPSQGANTTPPSPWRGGGQGGGVSFLQQLSELTGADIAASDDLTGNWAKGGDWELEKITGNIESSLAFQPEGIAGYQGVLATFNVAAGDVTGLINAISSANDETTNPGADIINLVGDTYTLTSGTYNYFSGIDWGNSGLPVITSEITINGNGATIARDNSASTTFRLFTIGGSSGKLTLNDVTLENGNVTGSTGGSAPDAGAISNISGTVNINNSTIRNNAAADDGGAIANFGTMNIQNSTISNNTAQGDGGSVDGGGAIENDGASATLNLTNTTISGNIHNGSGIGNAQGGAIRNRNSATLNIVNSTIFNNKANSSTGGGIFVESGTVTVKNSIVIGNTATTDADVSGTFTSNNANIIGNVGSSSGFGSDITGVAAGSVLNPTLANNGGSTQTHALIAGSVAINAANNTDAPTIDQRGGKRVGGVNSGSNADIGAYEATSSYVVTNTNDNNGIGSLRSAMNFANINVNPVTANPQDTIRFSIGSGKQTIAPTSALPTITQSAIIDGTTQPGFTTTPIIELNGTNAGATTSGLTITAGNSTVRGLAINRFKLHGILLQTNGNNVIEGNYIGTDVNGTIDRGNTANGILIDNSPNNTIGGTTALKRNIISGNDNSGIYVIGNTATGNQIKGNYIGTNATGTASLGNSFFGGVIISAPNNIIGGTATGAGNLISGNNAVGAGGIRIGSSTATGNQILGNLIGTDVTGTSILGNNADGVNTIASNTMIGGTTAGARNIISGNSNGVVIELNASNNQVQGNYIGTDITGNVDLGNTFNGVSISSPNNTIGGTTAAARNIISGNNSGGISITGSTATGNQVLGNYIGTKADGTSSLGNSSHGIAIFSNAANNAIGSTTAGAGNTIAFSSADGVSIQTSAGTGNAILGNSIFSNTGLGIDIGNDGVQANDTGDTDTGANNLQNYPLLTGATSNGTSTSIAGTFNSTASTTFTLQFFSNPTLDPTGYGEGQTLLGSTTVTTDASGNASYTTNFATAVAAGQYITATATDPSNNTSEFSQGVLVTAPITPGAVLINEIVTDPQQDWSTNNFNGTPGGGTISQGVDEWVELYIAKDGLNLTGATIHLLDGTPVTGTLIAGGAFQKSNYIGSGGGSFTNTKTGDYLVMGNVSSSGQMSNSITIVLKDPGGAVIDQVQLGGGAPNGAATAIGDQAVARVPNATDTDNDASDFRKQAATLGYSNNIPEIQVWETATNIPDNTGSINYGTTPLGTAITKSFTVKNTGFNDLTLNTISLTGTGFSLASPFGSTTIAAGNSTTFAVKLDAANAGTFNGNISFGNNDADENPFNFDISGAVQAPEVSITAGTNPNEEGVTNGTLNVKLSSPAPTGGLTINFTPAGTGNNPADYSFAAGTNIDSIAIGSLTIAAGKDTATINVVPIDDNAIDPGETVQLTLSNGTNYTVSATQNTANLEIIDNDSSIQFDQANYQVNEDGTVVGVAITLNRTGVITGTSNIDVQLANGTATGGGTDFDSATKTITFAANETSQTVVVPITEDNLVEGNENLTLTLANPSANTAIGTQNTATLEIIDNDSSIQFDQANYQVNEDGTVVGVAITLNRTGVTTGTSSVDVQLTNGTATGGGTDFDSATKTITFAANETSQTVVVPITEDNLVEGNENLTLTLANPSANTAIGTQNTATLEIIDNDSSVEFDRANYQVNEDGTVVGVAITLNRTGVTTGTSSVDVQLSNGTATGGGTDFDSATKTITFAANETSQTVVVPITEDNLVEGNENLTLTLANPSANTAIGTQNTATLEIIDNDSSVEFDRANYQVNEDGTVVGVAITLNRTGVTTGTSSVDVQLSNGTATGGGTDFDSATKTITFAANETSQTVVVPITEDNLVEGNENLTLTLANPSANTAIGTQNTATLEIIDNDSSIQFDRANYQVNEDGTVVGVAITLNRTGVTTGTSSVDVQLSNGTATGGGTDFDSATKTITFAANETTKNVVVSITEDSLFEGNENLTLTLANPTANTSIGTQNTAILEILDNDSPPTVAFSQANYQVNENGTVVGVAIAINRTGDTSSTSSVQVQLTNGTATGGADFNNATQTITFAANETSKIVTVPITDDSLFEGNENLTLTLVNPSVNTTIGSQSTANITIVDNDIPPTVAFSQANYQVNENGTVVGVAIAINRTGDTSSTSSVQVQLTNGTATGGADFKNATQTITFAANETSKIVTVPITDDSLFEGNENLTLTLVNPSVNTTIGSQSTANITIVDNDIPPTVAFSQANYQVNENGTVVGVAIAINRTGDTSSTSSVQVQLTNGTATGGADFNNATQTISFAANETTKTVTVPITDDSLFEGKETLNIELVNPSAGTNIGTQKTATLEIIENDSQPPDNGNLPTISIGDITIAEGNSGTTPANFTLTLSAPSNQSVVVQYATADGTATTADNDYNAVASESITFNPGETNKIISVAVKGDIKVEGNENFFVNLIGVANANIADRQGVGTIINDDTEEDCFCEQLVHPNLDTFFDEGGEGYLLAQPNQTSNTISGTESDDNPIGTDINDEIYGLGGDDFLVGKAGSDNFYGHNGKDTIFGGSDRDWISGHEGDDVLNGNQDGDIINGNEGNDIVRGGKGEDIVRGGQDNDHMWGDSGNDTLMGDKGNDTICGGVSNLEIGDANGSDLLLGGEGDDFLNGNEGNDTVCGDDGNDTVRGGRNDDIVFGDAGNDLIFGDFGSDSLCGEDGDDTIYAGNGSDTPVGDVAEKDCLCGGEGNDLLFGNGGEDKLNGDEGDDTLYGGKHNDSLTGGAGKDWLSGDLGNDMLRGGSESDRFFFSPGYGTDTILDFEDNIDLLELGGNLSYSELTIKEGSGETFISITKTGEILVTLKGISANLIDRQDFVAF